VAAAALNLIPKFLKYFLEKIRKNRKQIKKSHKGIKPLKRKGCILNKSSQ